MVNRCVAAVMNRLPQLGYLNFRDANLRRKWTLKVKQFCAHCRGPGPSNVLRSGRHNTREIGEMVANDPKFAEARSRIETTQVLSLTRYQ